MTRLLFGQSYFLRFDPKLWDAMQPYPPLGTLYAAGFMREAGYSVALFDAMLAESETEWAAALDRERPDLAVIYEDNFNYLSKMCLLRMRDAAFTMAGMAADRGIPVIIAGSDASDHPENYLDHGADYALIGEGELTLRELSDALTGRSDRPLESIAGLAWRETDPDGKRRIRRNPRRPDIRDLDHLPFPAWDLVDVERYRRIWLERHGYFSMNMVTTRGCPFHCNWCAKPIWGQRYNSRGPENVAQEMKFLKETYAPDHIWFVDDIMGLKPGWLEGFSAAVARLDAGIPFKCLSRVDLLLRPGETEALARAGAEIVWVGAESGSQAVLTAMEKGTQVEQIYAAAAALREAGIRVGFFLQFGYPGETRADVEATLGMVRQILPDDIGMSVSYPLPGTTFFERVRDDLGERRNWIDSNDLAMLYRGSFTTGFYRQLHTVLHKEYRMRKSWQALRRGRFDPRRTAGMVYQAATLPFERRKLDRMAGIPHEPARMTGESMPLEEASRPSPQ
ncbi:MAG TPA: radical SAM protein [Anaerolineales bacterium]|nr:radical SAM protein [Anaerolineales bacterium]